MYLVSLIYASIPEEGFSKEDIEDILTKSKKNNERDDITGMLCFNHNYFLQCLEGSRESVNRTYSRICNDNRHKEMVILEYKEIHKRVFQNWSMGPHVENKTRREINLEYSTSSIFDPYKLSGKSASLFLEEIKNLALK
jgi:hypothetical protein